MGKQGTPRRAAHPWGAGVNSEEVRTYVQERVGLFAKILISIFPLLLLFPISMYEIHPETRPERAWMVHWVAFAIIVFLGGLWFFGMRRRKVSLEGLYAFDVLSMTLIGVCLGLSAFMSSELLAAVYTAYIWHSFLVLTRVIIVPSTARRTLVVTTVSFAPILISGVGIALANPEHLRLPPDSFVVGMFLFIGVSTALTTIGSRVIYGLRRKVEEAMQLGVYTLGEKIGEGGMGQVFRATHALLRRPTAVKLLAPDKVGADSLARFEREVQHTSRLTHPNTVAVFDYGRTPDGVFYYAMEFLDGIDLETLVRHDGPQDPARVVHILRQICGALDEAHTEGLTHRDIKPANVMLCERGRVPDVVKVLDFGLVKELEPEDARAPSRVIAGTPAYLAPEAATDPGKVGPATDLYAVGAVGYYLLTGQRVFAGATAVEICLQHVTGTVIPPSERTDRPIPADLEELILACLELEPARRPASADALRRALGELPVYEEWDEGAASLWWEAHRERAAGGHAHPADSQSLTIDLLGRTELAGGSGEDETRSGLLDKLTVGRPRDAG